MLVYEKCLGFGISDAIRNKADRDEFSLDHSERSWLINNLIETNDMILMDLSNEELLYRFRDTLSDALAMTDEQRDNIIDLMSSNYSHNVQKMNDEILIQEGYDKSIL